MTLSPANAQPMRVPGLWGFPLLYLGWAYLFWLPLLFTNRSVWSPPSLYFFLAGGASPLIAGLIMAVRDGGVAQLKDMFERLIRVRSLPLRWWLVLLCFWLVFDLLMGGTAVLLGVTDRPFAVRLGLLTDPGALGFLLLLSFLFPAVEEIGLRGYWLDVLLARFGPTAAGLINGVAWALWHAPFVLFPGYYANTTFNPSLSWWLPMIVCTTLLITQVYRFSGRLISAVLLFHAMMNFTGEVLGITAAMYPFVLSGYVLAALALVLCWRLQRPG